MKITEKQIRNAIRKVLKEEIEDKRVTNDDVLGKIFVSYGTPEYVKGKTAPMDNKLFAYDKANDEKLYDIPEVSASRMRNKPYGGLWASPIDSNYGWRDFCMYDTFNVESLKQHFIFRLKPTAKIYILNNENDIAMISNLKNYWGYNTMNFDMLKEEGYDGIFATINAIRKCKYYLPNWPHTKGLETWDAESICIFNEDVVEPLPENEFEKFMNNGIYANMGELHSDDDYLGGQDSIKKYQKEYDYERYGNRNLKSDNGKVLGKHPALLAQDEKNGEQARKYNGTFNSLME